MYGIKKTRVLTDFGLHGRFPPPSALSRLGKTVNFIPYVAAPVQPTKNFLTNFIRKALAQNFKFNLIRCPFVVHHDAGDRIFFKGKFRRMGKIKYPMQTINISCVFQTVTPYPETRTGNRFL